MEKIFSSRLEEAVLDDMNRWTRQLRMTKKQFLEEAIRLRVRQAERNSRTDVWDETLGAWTRDEPPEVTVQRARKRFRNSFQRHHGSE